MLKRRRGAGAAIALNDGLMERILLRVPSCDGHLRLRAVCKTWLSIIDDPRFRRLLHQRRSARPPAAFLLSSPTQFEIVHLPGEEIAHSRSLRAAAAEEEEEEQEEEQEEQEQEEQEEQEEEEEEEEEEEGAHGGHPELTPSCQGVVCVYSVRRRKLMAWNPITGEAAVLAPLPSHAASGQYRYTYDCHEDRQCCVDGCFSTVGLGFDPPTMQYKVVVMSSRRFHVLTLGTGSWRTYEVTASLHSLWFVSLCFCYNGVVYCLICSISRIGDPALLTFDLGKERIRVHYRSQDLDLDLESCADVDVSTEMNHRLHRVHESSKLCTLTQMVWISDSGRTVEVWTWSGKRRHRIPLMYREASFHIQPEEEEAAAAAAAAPPPAAPLCIQMGRTLVCDEPGFGLYLGLLKETTSDDNYYCREISDRLSLSSSLQPVSLHHETLLSWNHHLSVSDV